MRTLPRLIAGVTAVLGLASCAPSPEDRVVATVGETRITAGDFLRAAAEEPGYLVDPGPAGKEIFLEQLVDRALLLEEAKRLGFDEGSAYESVLAEASRTQTSDALFHLVVGSRVRVSEAEAKTIWALRDTSWRLSQIFVYTRPEAEALRRRLVAGEPFERVVRSAAVEPASGHPGGDLGWLTAGEMPGPIEKAVLSLPVGAWSEPIEAPVGYYLIQVTSIEPRERAPYETERAAIWNGLRLRKERAVALAYVKDLKHRYHLRHRPEAYRALAARWQNRDTEDLMRSGTDPQLMGFTPEERAQAIVVYDGGRYTIDDFFADMRNTPPTHRAPIGSDPLLRLHIEDQVVSRLLEREAARLRLAEEPETARRLTQRGESYLVDALYERVVTTEAAARYQANPPDLESVNEREAESLFSQLRLQVLEETLRRLRREHPPLIDRAELDRLPWPVPKEETL